MIHALRADFNGRYTDQKYAAFCRHLEERTGGPVPFRVAETPVFLPATLVDQLVSAGMAMTHQLVGDAAYLHAAAATIPPAFRIPGRGAHPNFMTVDFGLVQGRDGKLQPKLVELQAFPSLYGYQWVVGQAYRRCFDLDATLQTQLIPGDDAYWALLRKVIVADHQPETVVLMEVAPERQKTLPDFRVHAHQLGIAVVDIADIVQVGRQLFYRRDGRQVPIRRIYNRAIAEDVLGHSARPGFAFTDELDVEWAGHPDWYFLISKFSLPYLRHRSVPPAVFLDRWMRGEQRDRLPEDRERLVLKPLYSFAGKGIRFAPDDAMLHAIPAADRGNYLLQERQTFAATVQTPHGPTQAEIRILYAWPDGGALTPVNTLVRLGRGQMMGVDHNRDQRWVGGSAGLIASSVSENEAQPEKPLSW